MIREGEKVTEAIQVTYSLKSEDIRKKEIAGLITEDEFEEFKIDVWQINILPVWYWMFAPSA